MTKRDSHERPTRWARQHGSFETVDTGLIDPALEGRALVSRRRDTLAEWHVRGLVTAGQLGAGRRFQATFERAHLDPQRAADPARLPSSGPSTDFLPSSVERARNEVAQVLDVLGGTASPIGQAAWFVLGVGLSPSAFARRMRWGSGAPMDHHAAQALAIGALCVLERCTRS